MTEKIERPKFEPKKPPKKKPELNTDDIAAFLTKGAKDGDAPATCN